MSKSIDQRLTDPEIRKVFEEELLFGEVTETLAALVASLDLSQKEVARRLSVSEGRISQILSGGENLTLRSLATLGWALGIRFALDPAALSQEDREGTPAGNDAPIPAWLTRMQKLPTITYQPALKVPARTTERPHLRLVPQNEGALAA